jgi:hypothetical protein
MAFNQERIEDLAGRVEFKLELNSILLLDSFQGFSLKKNGFNEEYFGYFCPKYL